MTTSNAGNAYVTISIREAMAAGLSAAKQKMSAFAEYAENSVGKKMSKAMSFGDLAKGVATGALLSNLAQIALENKNIAAAAERANVALRSMVLDVTADLEGELIWLLEMAGFLLKKMADGFKAIIAVGKDLGAVFSEGNFNFKNFNKVLDQLDRPSSGVKEKEIDKTHDKVQKLKKATQELTEAQKEYDRSWEQARSAGAGAISDLQREINVLKRGESSVKADEIYKEKLDAEYKLLEAQKGAERKGTITNEDMKSIQAARDKAQALKEQYLLLSDQKKLIEDTQKAEEEAAKEKQKKIEEEIQKRKEFMKRDAIVAGTSSAFAMAAGGGFSPVKTQQDILKETKEAKQIAKENLEQLKIIANGGMVFG